MEWIQYPQQRSGPDLTEKIIALEETAWPSAISTPHFPSAPDTYVTSFVLMEKEKAICHVGIRKSELLHRGVSYIAYGLSEVVTHPDYRRQGIGTKLIKTAADFILSARPDISIFTCDPIRTGFYSNGGWQVLKGGCLVGGTQQTPFRSDSLGLVTMIRFLSEKAIAHQRDFENADIFLSLGEGQLW